MVRKYFGVLVLIFIVGCAQDAKNFEYGLGKLNEIDSKYNVTMDSVPTGQKETSLMISELEILGEEKLESGQEAFDSLLIYRTASIEAAQIYAKGASFGAKGTTKDGFGCKDRPFVIESGQLRNSSAQKGFEAVSALWNLVEKYPREANASGLTGKNAVLMNGTFYKIYLDARSDIITIKNMCTENRTLEIYKDYLNKYTNLSDEYINNLDYGQAVIEYKDSLGLATK